MHSFFSAYEIHGASGFGGITCSGGFIYFFFSFPGHQTSAKVLTAVEYFVRQVSEGTLKLEEALSSDNISHLKVTKAKWCESLNEHCTAKLWLMYLTLVAILCIHQGWSHRKLAALSTSSDGDVTLSGSFRTLELHKAPCLVLEQDGEAPGYSSTCIQQVCYWPLCPKKERQLLGRNIQ